MGPWMSWQLTVRQVSFIVSLAIYDFKYVCCRSGPRFNIKTLSYQYRKSHCGDKTILPPSYLHNGISYTGKMTSLYWIGAQMMLYKLAHKISQNVTMLPESSMIWCLCDYWSNPEVYFCWRYLLPFVFIGKLANTWQKTVRKLRIWRCKRDL